MVITNFLLDDQAVANLLSTDENYLMENDYVEVKFLEADNGDISVTKFLYDDHYASHDPAMYRHYDNDLMDNDTLENGKRKKKAPKNGKKKKKGGSQDGDYDPHEVIVHFQNELMPEQQTDYYLQ